MKTKVLMRAFSIDLNASSVSRRHDWSIQPGSSANRRQFKQCDISPLLSLNKKGIQSLSPLRISVPGPFALQLSVVELVRKCANQGNKRSQNGEELSPNLELQAKSLEPPSFLFTLWAYSGFCVTNNNLL